jgi:precorrin-3B C17-methyltransferase
VARDEESVVVTSLAEAPGIAADMATLVIIGSAETRIIPRVGRTSLVYTPRAVEKVIA